MAAGTLLKRCKLALGTAGTLFELRKLAFGTARTLLNCESWLLELLEHS